MMPMNVTFTLLSPNRILTFRGLPCSSRSISSLRELRQLLVLVEEARGRIGARSPTTAKNGTCTAPSASDLDRSMKSSRDDAQLPAEAVALGAHALRDR